MSCDDDSVSLPRNIMCSVACANPATICSSEPDP